jgi:hypothetical protein
MAEKEVVYITPPNNLRQKQKLAGVSGTIDPVWMEAAERSILTAKFDYLEAAQEDMRRSSTVTREVRAYFVAAAVAAGLAAVACVGSIGVMNSQRR